MDDEEINQEIKRARTYEAVSRRIRDLEQKDLSQMNVNEMRELSSAYRLRGELRAEFKAGKLTAQTPKRKIESAKRRYISLSKDKIVERIKFCKNYIAELEEKKEAEEDRRFQKNLRDGRNITGCDCWQVREIASQYSHDPDSYESKTIRDLSNALHDLKDELNRR